MARNKYHQILARILNNGRHQVNKKGNITYLINEQLSLTPADLLEIFEGHGLARKKLRSELRLFMSGERSVEKYREAGINWWDYCGSILVNSYPTYFEKLPPLLARINTERRPSKNYVLFLGATEAESNQDALPVTRSVPDRGRRTGGVRLPAQLRRQPRTAGRHIPPLPHGPEHRLPLKSITLFLGNVHVYDNNIDNTRRLLAGEDSVKFELNV